MVFREHWKGKESQTHVSLGELLSILVFLFSSVLVGALDGEIHRNIFFPCKFSSGYLHVVCTFPPEVYTNMRQ